MIYEIKRNNDVIASVQPVGYVTQRIMAEDIVSMQFVLPSYVTFKIGDVVEVYGNTYTLNQEPQVHKVSRIEYQYTLSFESIKYQLGKIQLLGLDANNELTEPEFAINGTAETIMSVIIENANRVSSGWSLGTVLSTEVKNIAFSTENVLSALAMLAVEFETEYWVDGNKTIHLVKKDALSGLQLEYGKSKGLRSITRSQAEGTKIVTRLYASGSDKNLPPGYGRRLKMNVPYLERNTATYGIIEHSELFEDIYPHRVGKVTAVFSDDPLRFTDSTMPFNLNGNTVVDGESVPILLPGISAKVTFNTGQLAGYTFEIKENGYNHATRTFTLLTNKDEKAIEVPSELIRPAVNDEYVITDIVMPQSYITTAENSLKTAANDYLIKNSVPRLQYAVQADPLHFKREDINLRLGNLVRFVDSDFGLNANLRVTAIVKDLQNPYAVEFELAEQARLSLFVVRFLKVKAAALVSVKEKLELSSVLLKNKDTTKLLQSSINAETQARIQAIQASLTDAKSYADAQDAIKETSIKQYADGKVSAETQARVQAIQASLTDAKSYADAQDAIKETSIKQYADGKVSAETQARVQAIQASLTDAKSYADAQDAIKETSIKQYADGKVSAETQARVQAIQASLTDAKSYADAQDAIKETSIKQYADGKVSAETQARVQAIQANLTDAKSYADAQDLIKETSIKQYADGKVSAETQARIQAVQANLAEANNYSKGLVEGLEVGGRNLIPNSNVFSGFVSLGQNGAIVDITEGVFVPEWGADDATKINITGGDGNLKTYLRLSALSDTVYTYSFYLKNTGEKSFRIILNGFKSLSSGFNIRDVVQPGESKRFYYVGKTRVDYDWFQFQISAVNIEDDIEFIIWHNKLEKGNKATDWTPAPEDLVNESKSYADTQDLIKETSIKQYADGKVSAETQARVQAIQASLTDAKSYADAQDAIKETSIKQYADGKVSAETQARVQAIQASLTDAKSYADAQDAIKETSIKQYADGKVSAETQARVQAVSNLQQQKVDKTGGVIIGGVLENCEIRPEPSHTIPGHSLVKIETHDGKISFTPESGDLEPVGGVFIAPFVNSQGKLSASLVIDSIVSETEIKDLPAGSVYADRQGALRIKLFN